MLCNAAAISMHSWHILHGYPHSQTETGSHLCLALGVYRTKRTASAAFIYLCCFTAMADGYLVSYGGMFIAACSAASISTLCTVCFVMGLRHKGTGSHCSRYSNIQDLIGTCSSSWGLREHLGRQAYIMCMMGCRLAASQLW